ncbi:MAG: CHRD domain-containing protein, partial [Cyclobacteriaceae bacterium]
MKKFLKSLLLCSFLAISFIYLTGCSEDDPGPQLTGDTKTYDLNSVSNPAVNGTVTFAQRDDDQVLVTIQLAGTQSGNTHPAHLHANSAAEGGGIVLDLTAVNGATGKSETVVKALNDGTTLTYDDILAFDGYVNVHASASDLGTLIGQGDIGQNELSGDEKVYPLAVVSNPDISGTATFAKRINGETLVTVSLNGTTDGGVHPSHIHANSAAKTGGIVIDLSDIDGTTGIGRTNIAALNDATPITYEELLNFDGYLNVHLSATEIGALIAQGDIGQNELTGDNKIYTLQPVANPAVTGTATFAKRKNGTTLVTVALTNTTPGASHSSHIHAKTIAEGGSIVINLNNVDGTTGKARTSVTKLNDVGTTIGAPITYEELLNFNGYLNVHVGSSFVAQGDIGQNELTGVSKTYTLNSVSDPAISGTAIFAKRKNGNTLISIALQG